MRLLRVDTLALQNFTDESKLPQYAILSHTWLRPEEGEEVLFSDINDLPAARAKKGWRKVEFATQRAQADGLEFVWIDTCCIDKSSSAELSESINSMYRWYRNSEQCYVFLDDMVEQELKACRWFTRGWTLQEMLASPRVAFYDTLGSHIGTLNDLAESIATITGVHADLLKGHRQLASFSIAQKMHWASKRITTRTEDRAYSMLGLFDVSLAVIYGEGDRAFQRLQEELLRVYSDHSIFAWGYRYRSRQPPPSRHRHVPGKETQKSPKSLLARSPDDFASSSCKHLISARRDRSQREYEVMGRCINFDLPIFDAPESRDLSSHPVWTALLNCCLETRLTTYIVICLLRDPSGNFIRLCLDHCEIYDAALRCISCSVTILRYPNDAQHDLTNPVQILGHSQRFMLRCKYTTERGSDVSIQRVEAHVKVNPQRHDLRGTQLDLPSDDVWDQKTGILDCSYCHRDGGTDFNSLQSPVILEARIMLAGPSQSSGVAATVTIYPEIFKIESETGLMSDCVFTSNSITRVSFDRDHKMGSLGASLASFQSVFLLEDWRLLTASVVQRQLLQDRFCVIEFEVKGRVHVPYFIIETIFKAIRGGLLLIALLSEILREKYQ